MSKKNFLKPSVVTRPVIPATQEAELGKTAASPGGKSYQDPPSQQISQVWRYTPVITTILEVQVEG
jgi:hypothetical protein